MKQYFLALAIFLISGKSFATSTDSTMATLSNYLYKGKAAIGKLLNGNYEKVEITSNQELFTWKRDQLFLSKKGENQLKKGNELIVQLSYERNGLKESRSFRIVKDQFNRNPVIAHRGAWKTIPTTENSIAALKQAVKLGCAGTEFDVHMTKDDSLVVNHDPHYKGKAIEDYTYAELSAQLLDNGEMLPTLRDYLLEGMKQYGTRLIVEVKPTDKGAARAAYRARKTVELVHKLGAQAWVNYISFDYLILLTIRQLDPEVHVQYLSGNKSPDELLKDGITGLDYHLSVFQKNEDWIEQAKKNKMVLNVWTVNEEKNLHYFLRHNFPMITTNEPELLFTLLRTSPSVSK